MGQRSTNATRTVTVGASRVFQPRLGEPSVDALTTPQPAGRASSTIIFISFILLRCNAVYYAPARRGIKQWCCLTFVCLSRISGLSREHD